MAKGNRTINLYKDDVWKSVFFESVGTYVNVINNELSQEYPLEPLSDYIKIGGGYAFKTSEYKKRGIPIIRISDFNNEQIDISNCVYYDEDVSLSKYELKENDIIICLTGGTIAKLGIVQAGLGKLYMNQRVGRFDILDNSKFEKEYVYWIARSVQSIIKNLAWGAAIPNVSPKQIEKLQFSFPTIEVQRQIIEFLNDLKNNTIQNKVYFNESIERHIIELQNNNVALKVVNSELTHQLELIKQLRQAFLHEAMQGKLVRSSEFEVGSDTGHVLLAKIKAEKAQLIAEKKLKKDKELPPITEDEIPFEIPEHWAWCKLGEVCKKIHYGFNASAIPEKREVRLLRITDIQDSKVNWETVPGCDYSESDLKNYLLNENDILIARTGGTIGKTYLVKNINVNSLFASYLIRAIPFKNIFPEFLKYFLESPDYWKQLQDAAWGAGQPNVNGTSLSNLVLSLPPLHEQEQIVAKLEELMAFCDGLEHSINVSIELIKSLLQNSINDTLGVKNIKLDNKETKQKIKRFYTNGQTFETVNMKIIEILQTSKEPISATVVWNSSEFANDIEKFYAELKRLIDIEKLVVEEKIGNESYLKLATHEN